MSYSFTQLLWLFFIYGFAGWCVEVIFHAANKGIFINRGFLIGPICPIYGYGLVAVILALTPIKSNVFLVYIGSVVICSVFELIVGWASEKFMHTRLWDYTDNAFNIGGYVCLKFSGKLTKKNGDVFEGEFKNGKQDGLMIIHFADGGKFKGTFKNGKRNGKAIEVDKDGKRFEGSYKDDERDGKFTEKDRNGNITAQGMYTNGRRN